MNSSYRHGLIIAALTYGFVLFLQVRLTIIPYTNIVLTKGYDSDTKEASVDNGQHNKQHPRPSNRLLATTLAEHDRLAPKVAWLMSFPLSGGDYVIDVIHRITQKATGTNYGNILEEPTGIQVRNTHKSIPLYHERENGPYFFVTHLAMPTTYVPVSTYCTGYCWDCFPGRYTDITHDDFVASCTASTMFTPSQANNGMNGFGTTQEVRYAHDMVKKAAIMVRNPFKTIEERFLYSTRTYATDKEWLPRFEPNPRGFHDFCAEAEAKYQQEELLRYQPAVYQDTRGVLCHHEFFKLIQWYNYAFETVAQMGLEAKVIYYEDLADKNTFATAAIDMLSFFELTPIVDLQKNQPPLVAQSSINYMSDEEKSNVKAFFSILANSKTSEVFSRYFQ